MYCNLSKSQAIPLAVRVTSQPHRCFNPLFQTSKLQPFAVGSALKHPKHHSTTITASPNHGCQSFGGFHLARHESLSTEFIQLGILKHRAFSTGFRPRGVRRNGAVNVVGRFSNGYAREVAEDGGAGADKSRKTLPWLRKGKESKRAEKTTDVKPSRSSWEDSADKFLKTGISVEEKRVSFGENRRQYDAGKENVEEEPANEEEEEPIDDPRWDRIKNRFNRVDDAKPRFERPEYRKWDREESWGRKTWKEATESTVPKMVGEGIYGVGPVLAALSARRREFYTLYVKEGLDLSNNNRKKKDKKGFEKVLWMAEKMGISKKEISKHDLNMAADNRPHQGLVLDASPLEMVPVKALDPVSGNEKFALWIALDEVTDPQNLGAIIRSSYFFGASGIVLCAKNSAPLSGVVSKASAGSLELMEVRSCKNMMQFLVSSAENGWRVLGGSVSSRAVSINEVEPGAPTILVLGSEGTGLRPLVERSCTELVKIPGNIPIDVSAGMQDEESTEVDRPGQLGEEFRSFLAVESLNVSVAAGVLIHHLIGSNCNDDHLGQTENL